MDVEPRKMDGHLLQILSRMAELVMREIEQDLAANQIPGAGPPAWAGKPENATLTTPTSTLDPLALASTGSVTAPSWHSGTNRVPSGLDGPDKPLVGSTLPCTLPFG